MKFISVKEWAEQHGVSERTARNCCAQGKHDTNTVSNGIGSYQEIFRQRGGSQYQLNLKVSYIYLRGVKITVHPLWCCQQKLYFLSLQ